MPLNLTKEQKELIIRGLKTLDTPPYNQELRSRARKLATKVKDSIPTK